MIFNSFQFIWLFPLIFAAYWAASRFSSKGSGIAKYLLLVVSYGVYAQWSLAFASVLLLVTALTYFGARALESRPNLRTPIIYISVLATLAPLLLFKYFNFITEAGASALAWIGIDTPPARLSWVVPLGLSFYTFQALGYLWDVYRHQLKAERNWWDYMLFVSYFPQLLCGPISKASELLPQLKAHRDFDYSRAVSGLRMVLWGMFLKVVIADRAGLYVDTVYGDFSAYTGTTLLVASLMYTLQIYGDFAGYSYIAVGVSRLLGIDLIVNFRRPYLAQSVSGFWRRWNISLTRWLTTYVYIPLGGSRRGRGRTYGNIMITFLVSGLWHGANFTFILWGALHGVAQVIEKALGINKIESRGILRLIRILVTVAIVNLGWILFRSPSVAEAFDYIGRIFTWGSLYVDTKTFAHVAAGLAVMAAVEIWMEFGPRGFRRFLGCSRTLRWAAYIALTLMILTMGVLDSGQFIYVQF